LTPKEKVRSYLSLVDLLVAIMRPNTEVVFLMRLTRRIRSRQSAILLLTKPQGGGRFPALPSTFSSRLIRDKGKRGFITNYLGKVVNKNKFLKSPLKETVRSVTDNEGGGCNV
jgi:hypothetical protein